jgi:hypothetical protein
MIFSRSIREIIQQRQSWRSYQKESLPKQMIENISHFLAAETVGPFRNNARFIISKNQADSPEQDFRQFGTYGMIKHAPAFIIGVIENGPQALEDYGYLMEKIILWLTDQHLATCWLGGSFNKSRFARELPPNNNEIMPAVSAVGLPMEKRSKRDKLIRLFARSWQRLPWDQLFFKDNFSTPLDCNPNNPFHQALEMIRLAPSASNRQPWRVMVDFSSNAFHFLLARSKGYRGIQKPLHLFDLQRIDLGIAFSHFELTLQEAGISGKWQQQPIAYTLPPDTEYCQTWIPTIEIA